MHTHKNVLFRVYYGLEEPPTHYFLMMEEAILLLSMLYAIRRRRLTFLFNETNDLNLDDMWFQQDGATCHAVRETFTLLQTKFPGSVIFQRGDIDWPQRSNPIRHFSMELIEGKGLCIDIETRLRFRSYKTVSGMKPLK